MCAWMCGAGLQNGLPVVVAAPSKSNVLLEALEQAATCAMVRITTGRWGLREVILISEAKGQLGNSFILEGNVLQIAGLTLTRWTLCVTAI